MCLATLKVAIDYHKVIIYLIGDVLRCWNLRNLTPLFCNIVYLQVKALTSAWVVGKFSGATTMTTTTEQHQPPPPITSDPGYMISPHPNTSERACVMIYL